MLSVKISRELKKIAEYQVHQLILLDRLEIQTLFHISECCLITYYGRPNVSKFAKLKFVVAKFKFVVAKLKFVVAILKSLSLNSNSLSLS